MNLPSFHEKLDHKLLRTGICISFVYIHKLAVKLITQLAELGGWAVQTCPRTSLGMWVLDSSIVAFYN